MAEGEISLGVPLGVGIEGGKARVVVGPSAQVKVLPVRRSREARCWPGRVRTGRGHVRDKWIEPRRRLPWRQAENGA